MVHLKSRKGEWEMAIRNFYTTVETDGVRSVGIGPKSVGGGQTITVEQRNRGSIDNSIKIYCFSRSNGMLSTQVYADGVLIWEKETER